MTENVINEIYHRPWGSYQTLALAPNYQVKILRIDSGGRLSLQKHFRRAEHWVVVQGSPTLTIGEESREYQVNERVYIPIEVLHRIENFATEEAVLVEVQVGDYLGEDDIVRVEDVYGRS